MYYFRDGNVTSITRVHQIDVTRRDATRAHQLILRVYKVGRSFGPFVFRYLSLLPLLLSLFTLFLSISFTFSRSGGKTPPETHRVPSSLTGPHRWYFSVNCVQYLPLSSPGWLLISGSLGTPGRDQPNYFQIGTHGMVARSLCAREERIRDGKKEQDETKSKRRRRRKNRRTVHRTSENTGRTSCLCVCVCACGCTYVYEYVCMGWIRCKEEGRRVRGRVVDIDRQAGRKGGRNRERERDVAKQRPSPISILIELNATSYLMPETRQKLQLNGDAISLYLPVHSSWLPDRSSPGSHRLLLPRNFLKKRYGECASGLRAAGRCRGIYLLRRRRARVIACRRRAIHRAPTVPSV